MHAVSICMTATVVKILEPERVKWGFGEVVVMRGVLLNTLINK